jgi:hypothetical protein
LPAVSASNLTAGDLVMAMRVAREVEEARRAADAAPAPLPAVTPPDISEETPLPATAEENVKSLSSARLGK